MKVRQHSSRDRNHGQVVERFRVENHPVLYSFFTLHRLGGDMKAATLISDFSATNIGCATRGVYPLNRLVGIPQNAHGNIGLRITRLKPISCQQSYGQTRNGVSIRAADPVAV